MTRIATDGAELGDLTFWDGGTSASFTNTTTNPSSGSRCYTYANGHSAIKNVPDASEYYIRTRVRATGVATIFAWRNGTTVLGSIGITSTLLPVVTITGSSGSNGVITFPSGQYILVEAHVKIGNSPNGVIEVLMDGSLALSYTGDTQPASLTTINNLQYTNTATAIYIDDIAINDTTGVNDNSWCGDGRILMMNPVAAGDVTQLTRGGTDTGANWSQVDEVPPDGDTTYVYSSGSGQYDFYNLSSGSSIVGASDTITRVYIESRSRELSATGEAIRLGIISSGSEYWSSDMAVTTSYGRYEANTWLENPATGLPWTITDLDNLQAGVKVI